MAKENADVGGVALLGCQRGVGDHERRQHLLRQRDHEKPLAAPAGAAGAVPKVAVRLPRDKARRVPSLLLCVRPHAPGDPVSGL
eukprot:scaffold253275_cov43-Prasinocladus_malaysianus.AAC.2